MFELNSPILRLQAPRYLSTKKRRALQPSNILWAPPPMRALWLLPGCQLQHPPPTVVGEQKLTDISSQ